MTPEYRFDAVTKDPAEGRQVSLDWYWVCAKLREGNRVYAPSSVVRPSKPNGFQYSTTAGGVTGESEPRWPTTVAGTVADGSVTWICAAATNASLNIPSSPSASSDPTGLTIASVAVSDSHRVIATYTGGTDGQDYDAVFTVTINGLTRIGRQKVQVRRR